MTSRLVDQIDRSLDREERQAELKRNEELKMEAIEKQSRTDSSINQSMLKESQQDRLSLLAKYSIESKDPIMAVIDYLDSKLNKVEKSLIESKSKSGEDLIDKIDQVFTVLSKSVAKRSFDAHPTLIYGSMVLILGSGFIAGLYFDKCYSWLTSSPQVSVQHFDNGSVFSISDGIVQKIETTKGILRIEVDHVKSHTRK